MTNYEYNIKSFLKALGEPNVEPVDKGWTMCCCPLAPFTHRSGKDSHPSFGITKKDGKVIYNCFTCGSGTLEGLVQKLSYYVTKMPEKGYRYNLELAKTILDNPNFSFLELEEFDAEVETTEVIEWDENFLLTFPHAYDIAESREYLKRRGVSEEESKRYNIRYDLDRQLVCFPIYDVYGRFCGLRGRGVTKEAMKHYDYDYKGSNNSGSVFFNEPMIATMQPVIVVEGQFDLIKVARVYPYVVAVLTSSFNGAKLSKLLQADAVMLMLDNDDTGRLKAEKLEGILSTKGQEVVSVFVGSDGSDPDSCSLTEIYETLKEYIDEKYLTKPIDKTI